MDILFYLIILGLYLWLCWFIANQFYDVAKAKGYYDKKYFWITFWLGPVGYALIIALPDRAATMVNSMHNIPANNIAPSNITALYDELPDL